MTQVQSIPVLFIYLVILYYTVKQELSCSSCNFSERNNRKNGGWISQKALRVLLSLLWGQFLRGEDAVRVISVPLANRFGSQIWNEHKIIAYTRRRVIGPISTPIDYSNTVFGDIVSLCESCRTMPSHVHDRVPKKGKASLPAYEKFFLT